MRQIKSKFCVPNAYWNESSALISYGTEKSSESYMASHCSGLKTSRRVETFKRQKEFFFFLFLSGKLYSNILIAGHLDLALSELRRFITLPLHQVVYDNMYYSIVMPLASYLALSFLILPSQEPSPQNGAWMIWKDRNICNFNSTEQLCHKSLQTCLGICGENGRKRKH